MKLLFFLLLVFAFPLLASEDVSEAPALKGEQLDVKKKIVELFDASKKLTRPMRRLKPVTRLKPL